MNYFVGVLIMKVEYQGIEITIQEAEEILSDKNAQQLMSLFKYKNAKGKFPFTIEEWKSLAFVDKSPEQLSAQLSFIRALPLWGKQYLVDLNTVEKNRRKGFSFFALYLDKLIDRGKIKFNDFMDLWERLIISFDGPEILNSDRLDEKVAIEVLNQINLLTRTDIKLNELSDLLIENKRYATQFENKFSEKRIDAEMTLLKLLRSSELEVENISVYNSDRTTDTDVNELKEAILKKTIAFDEHSYEKYRKSWEYKVLSNTLTNIRRKNSKMAAKKSPEIQRTNAINDKGTKIKPNRLVSEIFKGKSLNIDFPFTLIRWMETGQQLANGRREYVTRSSEIQKINKVLPRYAKFLLNNVGIYNSDSYLEHSEAWRSAQKKERRTNADSKSKGGYAQLQFR